MDPRKCPVEKQNSSILKVLNYNEMNKNLVQTLKKKGEKKD